MEFSKMSLLLRMIFTVKHMCILCIGAYHQSLWLLHDSVSLRFKM